MKIKKKNKTFIILVFVCIFFIFNVTSNAEVVDKVLAVVNDELITQSELDRILVPVYIQYQNMYKGDELILKLDEARRKILEQMIKDKLVLSEARKRGIRIKPEEIQERLKDFKNKFSSKEQFDNAIIEQNLSLTELKKRIEEELMKEKFMDVEVKRTVMVTPAEISEHYNANIDKFTLPEKVRAFNILIKIKEDETKEEAYGRTLKVLERLMEGEDFLELAKAYSDSANANDGGDLGYIKKGELKEELDDIVFSLKIGEPSDIIETEAGYYMFMISDIKEGIVLSLEEVYDKIRDVLYRQKAMARFEKITEELKKNAYISIK